MPFGLDYTTYNILVSSGDNDATTNCFNRQIVRVVEPLLHWDEKYVVFASVNPVKGIYMYRDISVDKDSSTWALARTVESNASLLFGYPSLMHDGNGKLHAMYRRYFAGKWQMRHAISNAGSPFGGHTTVPFNGTVHTEWPGYCLDTTKVPHAFCRQTLSGQDRPYHCYKDPMFGWQGPTQLPRRLSLTYTLSVFGAVAFLRGGQHCIELFFLELNPTYYEVTNLYSSNGGINWTLAANRVDSEFNTSTTYFSAAYDNVRDRIYFVYSKVDPSNGKSQIHLRWKTPLTQSWSNYTRVNAAFAGIGCHDPSVTIGPDGRVYVAWRQKTSGVQKGGTGLQVEA